MKKLLVISVLLGAITLSGCSVQKFFSRETTAEKNAKCVSYKEEIVKELEKQNDPETKKTLTLVSIFYSPGKKDCLYYATGSFTTDKNYFDLKTVFDFTTKELLLRTPSFCADGKAYTDATCPTEAKEFVDGLAKLKGE